MLGVIASAPEGDWYDMPEGTHINDPKTGRKMLVARIRRVGPDLDVEELDGTQWRFTNVSFTDRRDGLEDGSDGNIKVERWHVTWNRALQT
jgi:hypothetical protein